MATHENLLVGAIEGFYGQPWSQAERFQLFDWMSEWGLNTYVYAPKDDLKHRAIWREVYSAAEREQLRELIKGCRERKIGFIYCLSPGLDIRYSSASDVQRLQGRFEEMFELGCQDFALLFDDIPDRMDAQDIKRWGSLGSAQAQVTNTIFRWIRERFSAARLLFCPTSYCGRMAANKLGGEGYLQTIGTELAPEIHVFWTGPEIISQEITVAHIKDLQNVLRRKPLIWDNLHANDYDGRRFYCGPYAGRPSELKKEVSGLLTNPNNEFALNYVPIRTLAEFVQGQDAWDARKAYLTAMREWLPQFATIRGQPTLDELVQFGDCYYLPHEYGAGAVTLYERAQRLLKDNPVDGNSEMFLALKQQAAALREFCARAAELQNRPLFYALSRRVWELREELDLLLRCLEEKAKGRPCRSDFHLPDTYRGGLVAKLQRLLVQNVDGNFYTTMTDCTIRSARREDEAGAYYVCLKTGDFGKDGEPFYGDDPDALGRIFVGPYLAYEPELSLILEDAQGICGYALGAFDSRKFYARYEQEWRPRLCAQFPEPKGDPSQWTRAQQVHSWYHHPDYFYPEPYETYPSHLHIDLLPRAQGRGYGRRMMQQMMENLRRKGSPGAHLCMSAFNVPAYGFYQRLGFKELVRAGPENDRVIYMGKTL